MKTFHFLKKQNAINAEETVKFILASISFSYIRFIMSMHFRARSFSFNKRFHQRIAIRTRHTHVRTINFTNKLLDDNIYCLTRDTIFA